MLTVLFNDFQFAIQISKDGLPGRVPLWVILLSAFAGLLLLMLLILALWKVSTEVPLISYFNYQQQIGEMNYDLSMLCNTILDSH